MILLVYETVSPPAELRLAVDSLRVKEDSQAYELGS